MRGRLLFVTGAAVGYVLGSRAGRKRYDQIASAVSKVWESPGIQKQVNKAEDYVAAKIGEIPGALVTGVQKVVQSSSNRNAGTSSATTAPSAANSTSPATSDVAATVAEAKSAGSKASSASTTEPKKTT
jgi:hypothetical protein